jgi:predicted RNA-binding Zn ribbon-like protein
MDALFLGGHPALDFINTRFVAAGVPAEAIGDGAAFSAWLVRAGLLDAGAAAKLKRKHAGGLDAAAAEARRLRSWALEWLARWSQHPARDYAAELRRLNQWLERASHHREIVAADGGWQLREQPRVEEPADLVALLAVQLASLIANESPALVKRCAGPDCVLWFVDRSKAHRRSFCSASACGNRAKVAAFRERQRRDA